MNNHLKFSSEGFLKGVVTKNNSEDEPLKFDARRATVTED